MPTVAETKERMIDLHIALSGGMQSSDGLRAAYLAGRIEAHEFEERLAALSHGRQPLDDQAAIERIAAALPTPELRGEFRTLVGNYRTALYRPRG